jgi:hypothetical protein
MSVKATQTDKELTLVLDNGDRKAFNEIQEKFTDKTYFAKHFISALSESKSMTDAIENIIKKGWIGKIFNVLLFIFGGMTTALIGKLFK